LQASISASSNQGFFDSKQTVSTWLVGKAKGILSLATTG